LVREAQPASGNTNCNVIAAQRTLGALAIERFASSAGEHALRLSKPIVLLQHTHKAAAVAAGTVQQGSSRQQACMQQQGKRSQGTSPHAARATTCNLQCIICTDNAWERVQPASGNTNCKMIAAQRTLGALAIEKFASPAAGPTFNPQP